MTSLVDKLAAHWSSHGAKPGGGRSEEDVRAFEERHRVSLPADLRDYLLSIGGMSDTWPGDHDEDGYCLWPLERIRPLSEERPDSRAPADPATYFVFADYMDWSWAYAIRLQGGDHSVLWVGGTETRVVASSFTEFVELYLRDDPALYPAGDS